MPNGPVRDHPDLDEYVVPLEELERASGLSLFADLGTQRFECLPLCGAGAQTPCGVGAMDGLISGYKLLAHLKVAGNCRDLEDTWSQVVQQKPQGMGMFRAEHERKGKTLSCPLKPPPPPSQQASMAGG